jgi:glycosyltransferase involved in cell wall biosynthesis
VARLAVRILVLTFYYRPDLSACSFRATPLVDDLHAMMPPGSHIDVITTLPNRYHSFTADAPRAEELPGISIFRIALPRHKSGMIDQSRAFYAFSRSAVRKVGTQKYDIVFATSSRLMTAVLAGYIARRSGARLYLDIRDIFVDTMKDVASGLSWLISPVSGSLEQWAIGRAAKVNLVSPGFADYFSKRYPNREFSLITNGIDEEFLAAGYGRNSQVPRLADDPRVVLYAGNLGEGQGLHEIVPRLAIRLGSRVHFRIIGDGGRKEALRAALSKHEVENAELLAPMGRKELVEAYKAADVLFLHLNDYPAFRKVLPSKVFEYGATGKPVWAGVSGFAAAFVRSELSNATVFDPCDVDGAIRSFNELRFENTPRSDFVRKYSRARVTRELAKDILSIATARP